MLAHPLITHFSLSASPVDIEDFASHTTKGTKLQAACLTPFVYTVTTLANRYLKLPFTSLLPKTPVS